LVFIVIVGNFWIGAYWNFYVNIGLVHL
jgi:hypothetical protein